MSKTHKPLAVMAIALNVMLLTTTVPAHAGANCEAARLSARQMGDALELAARTSQWLDARGAKVVVLARAGQNLDEWKLRYSHLGFAYHDDQARAWRVVHKLNQCGSDRAELYRQGLAEFYMDDLYRYEGAVVILKPELQQALLALLQDNNQAAILHQKRYNMLAYPWAVKYQQSNQWAIETMALASEPGVTSRARAQAWLQFKGYQPSVLNIGAMKRLGARMTTANVAFDDHPDDKRYAGHIETVTVDSVFSFLVTSDLGSEAQVMR
ncbi:MAG: hypothetical protein RLY71_1244 [Pseudomonadota bacterium]|jgi:hypothetical protein